MDVEEGAATGKPEERSLVVVAQGSGGQPRRTPSPPAMEVRRALGPDVPVLAEVLARAFAQDPGFGHFVPQIDRRHWRLSQGMGALLRYGSDHLSETYTTADLAGAAIWIAPGRTEMALRDGPGMVRASVRMCGWRGLATIMSVRRVLDEHMRRYVPEPSYYLSMLGVDPPHQGQGIGSALMRPILERCDRERVPASLVTNLERNLALYERHGFRVVGETVIPKTAIPTWFMCRDPS
jgi:ribosomal protein S18 acetylase RimI-like enzyme